MTWLVKVFGQRAARPLIFILIAGVVLLVMAIAVHVTRDRTPAKQAEQTTASSEAISNAASAAIETITNRTVTEADIDHASAVAQMEITNATDPDIMRDAVLDGVCRQASHRNDPACTMR